MSAPNLDPSSIMQTVTAFWPSKVLLSAVELDLFTTLGERRMTAEELGTALKLHPRAWFDFFDTLVALKFLEREGDGPQGRYGNTPETAAFLCADSPAYLGGMTKMLNDRSFGFWNDFTTALKTGEAQSETRNGGQPIFEALYADPDSLRGFLAAMSDFQAANFAALAEQFDFASYKTLCDVGGALALLTRTVAARHPHLSCLSFDLLPVAPLAEEQIIAAGLQGRISTVTGDFFADAFPKADIVTMGNILHDWNLETKMMLIGKAYDALPEGGAFIAVENVIDDARRENVFGLLMSLNMLIEFGDAFDYTGADFRSWCSEVGFKRFDKIALSGPASALIAYK